MMPEHTITWVTPPQNQGQIVDVAYSFDADEDGWLWERTVDRSTGDTHYRCWHCADNDSEWQPWNATPSIAEVRR